MAAGGHFGWPKITFDRFLKKIHKMAAGHPKWLHFGWPKITFDRISRHLRSIHNFFFTKWHCATIFYFTIWLPVAILDDRKSLSIAFLAISDQYATTFIFFFIFFSQNGCRRPFWMTENHFRSHFSPFRSIRNCILFFHKMAAGSHFGWPKITFDRISRHFRSIRNFFFVHKMAAGGHFWWPKITFQFRRSQDAARSSQLAAQVHGTRARLAGRRTQLAARSSHVRTGIPYIIDETIKLV